MFVNIIKFIDILCNNENDFWPYTFISVYCFILYQWKIFNEHCLFVFVLIWKEKVHSLWYKLSWDREATGRDLWWKYMEMGWCRLWGGLKIFISFLIIKNSMDKTILEKALLYQKENLCTYRPLLLPLSNSIL